MEKCGGTFVRRSLVHTFGETNVVTVMRPRFDACEEDVMTCTMFRNPLTWYRSCHGYYASRRAESWLQRLEGWWGPDCWREDLNEFVEVVTQRETHVRQPMLTFFYEVFRDQAALIGTTENLRNDLRRFLTRAGYVFDPKWIIEQPNANQGAACAGYTQELTAKSRELILRLEHVANDIWIEAGARRDES
jgi:hypothetical protein